MTLYNHIKKYNFFIIIFLLYLFFSKNNFFLINLIAFTLCYSILYLNNYDFTRLTSIFAIGHLLQYPFASLLANSQEVYSAYIMDADLYNQTGASIGIMSIAMLGFIIGILLFRKLFNIPLRIKKKPTLYDPFNNSIIFLSFIFYIFYIIFAIITKTYFHSTAGEYNINNSTNFGFIGYLYYFGLISIGVSFYNYLLTKEKKDLFLFILIFTFFELLILPSGQRRFIVLPIFVVCLLYFTFESITMKQFFLIVLITPILIFLLPILEYVRGDLNGFSFNELLDSINYFSDKIINPDTGASPAFSLFIRRLCDYPSIGYIYNLLSTETITFYGFLDLIQSPLYILPTSLRPDLALSFAYDAEIMQNIGFRSDINGSSPLMLVGDFLIRGGFFSVFFGFILLGIIIEFTSIFLNTSSGHFKFLVWIFLIDYFSMLHTMTILKVFTLLTRHLIIFYLLSIILTVISKNKLILKYKKHE